MKQRPPETLFAPITAALIAENLAIYGVERAITALRGRWRNAVATAPLRW